MTTIFKRIFNFFKNLFKLIWETIKTMKTWRGVLALFLSFMIFAGWAYVLAGIGIMVKSPSMIAVGTAVILFWAGPFTPLIPIVLLVAFLIQRYIFRDRSNDEALKKAIADFKERGFKNPKKDEDMSVNKDKILLHICCGPCGVYPTKYFNENGYLYDGYFYNPNIHPESEYEIRLEYVKKLSEIRCFKLIVEEGYDEANWIEYEAVPKRCQKCYNMRLKKAFEYASKNNYKAVTTTLLISPYQQHELIKEIANTFSQHYKVAFEYIDFRPHFREGQNEAKELNFYRQKYCGCISSLEDKLTFDISKEEKKGGTQND